MDEKKGRKIENERTYVQIDKRKAARMDAEAIQRRKSGGCRAMTKYEG